MRLNKATLFALYAVLELAEDRDRQIAAGDIAAKYGISLNHLAKVLRDLGRAGLVEAARGVGGGYRFVGNPKRVTLMDVIEIFEDIGAGKAAGDGQGPDTHLGQALHGVLAEIEDIARATLRSVTIETLLKHARSEPAAPAAAAADD
ncbi:MAG: Rrf2 family transcriptional regulator [Alphaproteobacteria bacterium]|nr:Rrf2 family transcriptional regulator [Alphaproteobacteria bacterium]